MALKKSEPSPKQGEVWLFDPDPVRGNELGKKVRPCLVISNDYWNQIRSGLVIIVPLTSVRKGISFQIKISHPDGGLSADSFAVCEQIRSISKDRLIKKLGAVKSTEVLREIPTWIADLIRVER